MPVTVQGDVKDPRQLAQEMMPYMRQLFEDFSREQARRNLSTVDPQVQAALSHFNEARELLALK